MPEMGGEKYFDKSFSTPVKRIGHIRTKEAVVKGEGREGGRDRAKGHRQRESLTHT